MPDLGHIVLPDWMWVVLHILVVLVIAFLALRFARQFVHGIFKTLLDREAREGTAQDLTALELRKRMDTLDALGANLLQFFIVVIAGLMILGRLGFDIGPAVAGLGIVGIAVGFGAQSLVKDYFNGALILVENQYTKGDVIRIAGVEGTVEDLTLRRTTLRDFDGTVHTVPNSAVIVASNLTRGWARLSIDVPVAEGESVPAAVALVDQVGRDLAGDPAWGVRMLEPLRVERVDAAGPDTVTLRVVGRVEAQHRWAATPEVHRRLHDAFRHRGLPFTAAGADPSGATPVAGPTASPAPTAAAVGPGSSGLPFPPP